MTNQNNKNDPNIQNEHLNSLVRTVSTNGNTVHLNVNYHYYGGTQSPIPSQTSPIASNTPPTENPISSPTDPNTKKVSGSNLSENINSLSWIAVLKIGAIIFFGAAGIVIIVQCIRSNIDPDPYLNRGMGIIEKKLDAEPKNVSSDNSEKPKK